MIKSIRNAALKQFFEKGISRKLPPEMTGRINAILNRLNTMENIEDMRMPQYKLHALRGKRRGQWAVAVSGNYRITFRFVDGCVYDVDFCDYH